MPGIYDNGSWKDIEETYIKENDVWRPTEQIWQKNAGSWRQIWKPYRAIFIVGSNIQVKLKDGPYIINGTTEIDVRAKEDFQAEVVMWGGGGHGHGGYTYGLVNFKKNVLYKIVTNKGGGLGGSSFSFFSPQGASGGGYAALFEGSTTSVSISQTQALLVAGGGGGSFIDIVTGPTPPLYAGGGITGGDGEAGGNPLSATYPNGAAKGGKGATQTGGGAGGDGTSALAFPASEGAGAPGGPFQGGRGGNRVRDQRQYGNLIYTIYYGPGGHGGGGGYFGGGGGGGGGEKMADPFDPYNTTFFGAGGGGAGSGYVNTSKVLTPRGTTDFEEGKFDPDRGNGGDRRYGTAYNAKVVIRLPTQ